MRSDKNYLITGGLGFIGSNFIRYLIKNHPNSQVINLDKMTYAGNPDNLLDIGANEKYSFFKGDICDAKIVKSLINKSDIIVHFAAESHVDRSIDNANAFIKTNIHGTFNLLQCALDSDIECFLMVSTDEVYGSLDDEDAPFTELRKYEPNNPYSASKASADHLVRAYNKTYALPVITTNCSNNYGPYQFPEKLIPLVIHNAISNKDIPIYGDGLNIRDWLFVEDHCSAIDAAIQKGRIGQVYNVGGKCEKTNLEVVNIICEILDEEVPREDNKSYKRQITFVKDRKGHDRRYAIDSSKIEQELGWEPKETFESGLRKTVKWYLSNNVWVKRVTSGDYKNWIERNYE